MFSWWGPGTEFCRHRMRQGCCLNLSSLKKTVCFLLSERPWSNLEFRPWCHNSVNLGFSCASVSKALLKSNKISTVCFPACIDLASSSTSCISQDLFSRNPSWEVYKHFTEDTCKGDGTIIGRVCFIRLLENGGYISFFSDGWKLTWNLKDLVPRRRSYMQMRSTGLAV